MKQQGFENVEFPYTDERVFAIVMQDPERCRMLLERIFPNRKVTGIRLKSGPYLPGKVSGERTVIPGVMGHGVRFDVLFEDDDAWYDIEMQTINRKDLPKRTRYYHSMMDQAYLKRGSKYSELNPQYVIFICCFDLLDKGLPLYDFSMTDRYSGLILGDESYTMILNTKADRNTIPEELRAFYRYVGGAEIDDSDDLIKSIHSQVIELNDDKDWRDALMTWGEMLEERYDMGKAEGLVEGKAEGLAEALASLVKDGLLTLDQAKARIDDPELLEKFLNN